MIILRHFKLGNRHFKAGEIFTKPSNITTEQINALIARGYLQAEKASKKGDKA